MSIGLVSIKFGPIVISNHDLECLREDMANIFLVKWKAKNSVLCLFFMCTAIYCLKFKSKCDEHWWKRLVQMTLCQVQYKYYGPKISQMHDDQSLWTVSTRSIHHVWQKTSAISTQVAFGLTSLCHFKWVYSHQKYTANTFSSLMRTTSGNSCLGLLMKLHAYVSIVS